MEQPRTDTGSGSASLASASLQAFLEALASGQPAPGGGAAAALAAALATALVGMVCRVTMERGPMATGLVAERDSADGLRRIAIRLIGDDADAYRAVIAGRRAGDEAFQRALVTATDVPLEVVRISRETLALCETVAVHARPSVLGDLRACVALACSAIEAASVTVKANLRELTDPVLSERYRKELDDLRADGEALRRRALASIAQRMGFS